MNTVQLIREQLKTAHDWFEGTMAGVTNELANWQPPGQAHSIGSRYAHCVVGEDMLINGMVKGGAPLLATTFTGKTGVADPQNAMIVTLDWARQAKVDLGAMRPYAQAVYKATDDYIASLREEDLGKEVDLTQQGFGKMSLGAFLITFILGHVRDIMGEISAIKGVQDQKGYPF